MKKGNKPVRVRKQTEAQQAVVRKLFALAGNMIAQPSTKEILYKKLYGVRVPYAYVVFQSGRMCRHRDKSTVQRDTSFTRQSRKGFFHGPMCGDVWEMATYALETQRIKSRKCYMHGHVKPVRRKK